MAKVRLPPIEDTIESVLKAGQGYPDIPWLAQYQGVSYDEAYNAIINHYNNTNWGALALDKPPLPAPPVKEKHRRNESEQEKVGIIDRLLLWLVNQFQKISFIIVSLADFVIECLFYSTFGPNELTKIGLASWGFVIVGAKLWAWSHGNKGLAIFCAALSVIGATGIFNASMDAQAAVVKTTNAVVIEDPRVSIQNQINESLANIKKMTIEREKLADGSNPKQVLDYNNQINEANAQLPILRKELAAIKPESIKQVELQLDAWAIFGQISNKIGMDPKVFAFVFILLVAILIQWIIGATTPRKGK